MLVAYNQRATVLGYQTQIQMQAMVKLNIKKKKEIESEPEVVTRYTSSVSSKKVGIDITLIGSKY